MTAPSSFLSRALLLAVAVAVVNAQDGWQIGRASYYGTDGWSIHKGSCGLGYQYKSLGTGWDVAAIADASPEFSGSCGRCYEVRCDPRSPLIDGYGNEYDRSNACKVGEASVVVRTVDACPCVYPGNAYSNKRWCCGDHKETQGTHFDLSLWAFEKLIDLKLGVAGIEWRRVPCNYRPSNPAPDGPSPMPAFEQPSALGYPGDAFSPGSADTSSELLVMRFDEGGAEQGAVRPMEGFDEGTGATVVSRGELLAERGGGSASGSTPGSDSGSASDGGSDTGNGCTDTPPSDITCKQVKASEQCGKPSVLSGNYCRATCGRCEMGGSGSPPTPSGSPSGSDAASIASASASGKQPSASGKEPSASGKKSSGVEAYDGSEEQSASGKKSTASGKKSTASGKKSSASGKKSGGKAHDG